MRFRNLVTPSFRNRLRLFFLLIVIIPMIAVALVLFQVVTRSEESQTDAQLSEAQRVATNLYRDSADRANAAGRQIVADNGLREAIADKNPERIQSRLDAAARAAKARRVLLQLDGPGDFEVGDEPGVAPARNAIVDQDGRPLGRIVTSVDTATSFAAQLEEVAEVGVVIRQGDEVLGASRAELARAELPSRGDAELDGADVRVRTLRVDGFDGREVSVLTTLPESGSANSTLQWIVIGALAGFLLLAFAFAITVSRTLQAEVQSLLVAARAIGRGDFSKRVPTEGNDEFAALGKEFNSMAEELEERLEELQRERARLADAIRRVGESFTKSLDRVGLLEIVVQTAVDGVEAAAGRATIRRTGEERLREVAATGDPDAYATVLHAAEAAALDAGQIAEIELGGASALAAPLGGDGGVGIVSVARGERRFTTGEHELFSYLTNQASVSVENVDLHETVQRQAVTDELTGLFNHRRFQEVMTQEVERARRYGQEMGLIMLDIDNFKRVNDTYGHLQGDMVLREVARVLRQSSREIDEPARYGGEEMAVALPQTDLEGAFRFAERVRRRIEALDLPLLDGDGTLKVTASFGAASLASSTGDGKDALVAAADAALYRAKRSGKNRTVRAE
ncbi:MAG TPA: diguanylate cyclase [Solirubrobacteraceae bacterium]|nr:diguanylate cyclase [Solirubrobacteraceae bacterium]